MNDPVHILSAANSNYILPLTVMLVSVAANCDPARELVLHIVSNDATDKDREDVRQSILMNRPNLERTEIHWYSYDASSLRDLPVFSYFSLDVYSNLVGLTLLPDSVQRIIGLDCDVIVNVDISKLFDLPMGSSMVSAAQDIASPFVSSRMGVFDYVERGMDPKAKMLNSGVVVYDVKRWRQENLTERILKYQAINAKKVKAHDQSGHNAFLYKNWTELDTRWNQGFDVLFYDLWQGAGYSRKEWRRTRDHPYIIHFSGIKKPWQKGRRGPRYSYFFKYLKKSVFKDSLPGHPTLETIIGFRAYYFIWRLAREIPGLIKR